MCDHIYFAPVDVVRLKTLSLMYFTWMTIRLKAHGPSGLSSLVWRAFIHSFHPTVLQAKTDVD